MQRRSVEQRGLVEQAQRGDHDAFAVLAGAAIARLDAAARLILRDPELARDAVQDAMIRAWRDLPTLRDADKFDAWIHRLTVNACLDHLRRRRRRPIEVEMTTLFSPSSGDFSRGVIDRDLLDRALQGLEPDRRALVVLHCYLGMPLPEVAASLGIPLGTAKSRLHRTLELLRASVAFEADDDRQLESMPEGRFA